jgi:transposase
LEKQYKNKLSNFREFEALSKQDLQDEIFVFPDNFTKNMAIDETGLLNGELYTILSNKDAKCKKGAIAAFIKGTKADKITTPILDRVPYKALVNIDELTLDLANNMDWIARETAPNARHTYDRFHVQQLVSDALQAMRVKERWKAIDEENEAILEAKKNKQKYTAPTYSNGDTKKQLLARSRYLLYKTPNKLNSSQKERSKILFEEFPSLKKSILFINLF